MVAGLAAAGGGVLLLPPLPQAVKDSATHRPEATAQRARLITFTVIPPICAGDPRTSSVLTFDRRSAAEGITGLRVRPVHIERKLYLVFTHTQAPLWEGARFRSGGTTTPPHSFKLDCSPLMRVAWSILDSAPPTRAFSGNALREHRRSTTYHSP